jgi:class 3 adenylate cyclase
MRATSLISELDREQLRSAVIDGISVMALRFTDPLGLAGPHLPVAPESLFEELSRRFEQMAEENGIEYMKVMGEQMVFATGFEGTTRNVPRIADLALSIQEALMTRFADRNVPMGFRIGVDTGVAFGSLVGRGQPIYNLWGQAVNLATAMAESGIDGGIQVTQSAYGCLLDDYIFKLRGGFYVAGIGEIRTYLLRGKL